MKVRRRCARRGATLIVVAIAFALSCAGGGGEARAQDQSGSPDPCKATPKPPFCGDIPPPDPNPTPPTQPTVTLNSGGDIAQALTKVVKDGTGKIVLRAGEYDLAQPLKITFPLNILAAEGDENYVILRASSATCFDINAKGRSKVVALRGLRIVRQGGARRPCIKVTNSTLEIDQTILDVGDGPAIDLSSATLTAGGSGPGGIDRSVVVKGGGASQVGIKSDRKSELDLQWTEISGFSTAIGVEGTTHLLSGVRVHDNVVGLMIGGARDDADVFGPSGISVAVDGDTQEEGAAARARAASPVEFSDNLFGIIVGNNFEGAVSIASTFITSRRQASPGDGCAVLSSDNFGFDSVIVPIDGCTYGLGVMASIFQPAISISHSNIGNQSVAIDAAAPLRVGEQTAIAGNGIGLRFNDTGPPRRLRLLDYALSGVGFDRNRTDLSFTGDIAGALSLASMRWPREGASIAAGLEARFERCEIDASELKALKRKLSKESRAAFARVCHMKL